MRSIKREAKGISPVIATILLIAVTAVAGGVIAAYVAGLYVAGGRVIIASANGMVYDWDNSAQLENDSNGVVSITVTIQPGSATVRSIGDSAYGGTIITVTNPTTGFAGSVSLPDNTALWGTQITAVNTFDIAAWATANDNDMKMTVVLSPDTQGRLTAGGMISITLAPFSIDDAHSYETSGTRDIRENRAEYSSLWDERQTFNVSIAGRDSISLAGFDGAYLTGVAWID